MDRSESLIELAKALSKFQSAVTSVPKSSVNPFFHSKYASLDTVWDACRKPLADNGLALIQLTAEAEGKLYLDTLLLHISGEFVRGRYPISPMRQTKDQGWVPSDDPQSIGSAITYARRYAMSAMLGISADDDDDAERAMSKTRDLSEGNRAQTTQRRPPQQTAPPKVNPETGEITGPTVDNRTITSDQRKRLFTVATNNGVTPAAIAEWMLAFAGGKTGTSQLTRTEYDALVGWIENGGTLPEPEPPEDGDQEPFPISI